MIYNAEYLQPGDTVVSAQAIYNDGSFPGYADNELLVAEGSRGVLINIGHIEEQPNKAVFLVRFEHPTTRELGPEIGCWAEDLALMSA